MGNLKKKLSLYLEPIFPLLLHFHLKKVLKEIDQCFANKPDILFFFPAYHIGGAEKIHLQIMDTVIKYNISTFITNKSASSALKKEFIQKSNCFCDFNLLGNHNYFRKKIATHIAYHLNLLDFRMTVFGCNSTIFYDIVDQIKNPLVRKIDLLHAFSPYTDGIENRSVLSVDKLDLRIVINKKTKEDLKHQYLSTGTEKYELDKIKVIYNPIEKCDYESRNYKLPYRCIWVGRGSHEKRPWIYAKIADRCKSLQLPFTFSMIGNVQPLVPNDLRKNINFFGEINDSDLIKSIYKEHDILITTSIFEGFPLTITEAICNGLINISTDVGGISEHIKDDITGYLISNSQNEELIVEDCITVLKSLLNASDKLNTITMSAFEYVNEAFSKAHFTNSYCKYLIND